jgi:hypothetical protein
MRLSRLLIALGLCAAVNVTTTVAAGQTHDSKLSCTPAGADLSNPTPAHFTESQLAVLQESYSAPEVRGLRGEIKAFLSGRATATTTRTLSRVPRDLLRDRFILFNDQPGLFGGSFLIIQFNHHPQAVYEVWVYPHGHQTDVRTWDSAPCSPAQQRYLRVRYAKLEAEAPSHP